MFHRQTGLLLSAIVLAAAPLIGCGPQGAARGNPNPDPYWTTENPDASRGGSQGATGGAGSGTAGSSSLDALREGRSPETPASSPLQDVRFDFDRYDLKPEARAILKANAEWLKANPSAKAQIEGHCDERGTAEYNLALGAKRAQAAKDYLATLGISAERLSTVSYGEEIPVCREATEACWEKNRRDRFVLVPARPAS